MNAFPIVLFTCATESRANRVNDNTLGRIQRVSKEGKGLREQEKQGTLAIFIIILLSEILARTIDSNESVLCTVRYSYP